MKTKKLFFASFFLCLFLNSYGQINFTDSNFKNALLNHSPTIDTNGDNEVDASEALSVTVLNLDNKNISNLEGIQHFTNLEKIFCRNNSIRSIKTATLTKLRFLIAQNNLLKSIDVRTCNLWGLRLANNPLEYAYLNGPSTFQIEAEQGIYFDLTSIKYVCISNAQYMPQANNVDHRGFWNSIGNKLHIGTCTIVPTCPIINFPDPNFKTALLNHPTVIDTDGDGEICIDEAEKVGYLNLANKNINNIIGIEHFINVQILDLFINNITSADFSKNTKLKQITIDSNKLTSINTSKNLLLEKLNANNNQLTQVDLSNNQTLTTLFIRDNKLTQLTFTNNPKLTLVEAQNNSISSVNTTNNSLLEFLHLTNNKLTQLNLNNNTKLKSLRASNNKITELNLNNNTIIEHVDLENNILTSFDARNFTNIKKFVINNNPYLENLYLTGNHPFYQSFYHFKEFHGNTDGSLGIYNCPNLKFICVNNVSFLNDIKNYINNTLGYFSCTVSTNCDPTATKFEDHFTLSPNPTYHTLKLTPEDNNTFANTATILTTSGQFVKNAPLVFSGEQNGQSNGGLTSPNGPGGGTDSAIGLDNSALIDVSDINAGQYILSITTNKGTLTTMFIKL